MVRSQATGVTKGVSIKPYGFFLLVILVVNDSFLKALPVTGSKVPSRLEQKAPLKPKILDYASEPNDRENTQPLKLNQLSFFEKRAEGWHWYEEQEPEIKEQESGGREKKILTLTPTEEIEEQRKALEEKLHAAILAPTRENIISYLLAQKALMDQSERFSTSWKKVVMTTPSLDETLIHPVDQNARHIYYDEQRKDLEKRIKALSKEYGLFFFFRQNCPYCHRFSPIVKRFSEKYGWSVLAISLDGPALPEFPHPKRDNGIAARLRITHVPALIAIHPETRELIPLAYGMASESEIEGRVDLLTRMRGERK